MEVLRTDKKNNLIQESKLRFYQYFYSMFCLFCIFIVSSQTDQCPQGWVNRGPSCYNFVTDSHKEWREAEVNIFQAVIFSKNNFINFV